MGIQEITNDMNRLIPSHCAAVTPSDTEVLVTGGLLYVGTAGTLSVSLVDGGEIIFNVTSDGVFIPVQAKQVYATGTTATNIYVMW